MSDEKAIAKREGPTNVLALIQEAIVTKQDVETMRGLFELQKDFMRMQAEQAFHAAMARLQSKLPQVIKAGQGKNSRFAKLEDIDIVIRPLLAEEGFSFSFDEESHTDKTMTFCAKLSHEHGHSELKRLTVPIDTAAQNSMGKSIRPAIQDSGSTVSYARRYLIKMHLNLIERDEDNDGQGSDAGVTPEQLIDLKAFIEEVKGNVTLIYKMFGISDLKDLKQRDLKAVTTLLNEKRNRLAQK